MPQQSKHLPARKPFAEDPFALDEGMNAHDVSSDEAREVLNAIGTTIADDFKETNWLPNKAALMPFGSAMEEENPGAILGGLQMAINSMVALPFEVAEAITGKQTKQQKELYEVNKRIQEQQGKTAFGAFGSAVAQFGSGWGVAAKGTQMALRSGGVAKKNLSQAQRVLLEFGNANLGSVAAFDGKEQSISAWLKETYPSLPVPEIFLTAEEGSPLANRGRRVLEEGLLELGLLTPFYAAWVRSLSPSRRAKLGVDTNKPQDEFFETDKAVDEADKAVDEADKAVDEAEEVVGEAEEVLKKPKVKAAFLRDIGGLLGVKTRLRELGDWYRRKNQERSRGTVEQVLRATQAHPLALKPRYTRIREDDPQEYYQPNWQSLNVVPHRRKLGELDQNDIYLKKEAIERSLADNPGFDRHTVEGLIDTAVNYPTIVRSFDDGKTLEYVVTLPEISESYSVIMRRPDELHNWSIDSVEFASEKLGMHDVVFDRQQTLKGTEDLARGRVGMARFISRRIGRLDGYLQAWDDKLFNFALDANVDIKLLRQTPAGYWGERLRSAVSSLQEQLNELSSYGDSRGLLTKSEIQKLSDRFDEEMLNVEHIFQNLLNHINAQKAKQASEAVDVGKVAEESINDSPEAGAASDIVDKDTGIGIGYKKHSARVEKQLKKDLPEDDPNRILHNLWLFATDRLQPAGITRRFGGSQVKKRKYLVPMIRGKLRPGDSYFGEVRDILDNPFAMGADIRERHDRKGKAAIRKYWRAVDKAQKKSMSQGKVQGIDSMSTDALPPILAEMLDDGSGWIDPNKFLAALSDEQLYGYSKPLYEDDLAAAGESKNFYEVMAQKDNLEHTLKGYPAPVNYKTSEEYIAAVEEYEKHGEPKISSVASEADIINLSDDNVDYDALRNQLRREQELDGAFGSEWGEADDALDNLGEGVVLPDDFLDDLPIKVDDFEAMATDWSKVIKDNLDQYDALKDTDDAILGNKLGIDLKKVEEAETVKEAVDELAEALEPKTKTRQTWDEYANEGAGQAYIVKTLQPFIKTDKLEKITNAEKLALAQEYLDGDVAGLTKALDSKDNVGAVLAAMGLHKALTNKITKMAVRFSNDQKGFLDGEVLTDTQLNELAPVLRSTYIVQALLHNVARTSGQNLQAFRGASQASVKSAALKDWKNWQSVLMGMDNVKNAHRGKPITPEVMSDITRNVATISLHSNVASRYIAKMVRRGLDESTGFNKTFGELYITSLLSGFTDDGLNVVSNLLKIGITTFEAGVQGGLTDGMRALGLNPQGGATTRDFARYIKDIIGHADESIGMAKAAYWRGHTSGLYGGGNVSHELLGKYDALDAPAKGRAAQLLRAVGVNHYSKGLSYVSTRPLAFMDEFTKVRMFRASLNMDAHRGAQIAAQNVDAQKYKEVYDETLDMLHAEPTLDMYERAAFRADQSTSTQKLPDVVQGLVNVSNRNVLVKYYLPFVRSIYNDVDFGIVQRSWIGLFDPRLRDDFLAGGDRATNAAAKLTTAGVGWLATMQYLEAGNLTGSTGDWQLDESIKVATSSPPSTLNAWGLLLDLARTDPLGGMMVANMVMWRWLKDRELNEEQQNNLITAGALISQNAPNWAEGGAANLINQVIDKAGMQGIKQLARLMADPNRQLVKELEKFPSKFVPNLIPSAARAFGENQNLREIGGKDNPVWLNAWGHILNKMAWGAAPVRHDWAGVALNRKVGPTYIIGEVYLRNYNAAEKETALWHAKRGLRVPTSPKKIKEAGDWHHLTAEERSFYGSLRSKKIFDVGMSKMLKTWPEAVAYKIKEWQSLGLGENLQDTAMRNLKTKLTRQQKQYFQNTPEALDFWRRVREKEAAKNVE